MQEIIAYSMTDLATLRKVLPPEELSTNPPLRVANPMSRDFEYARTTLRAGLLRTLAANAHAGAALTSLFEVGRIYLSRGDDLPNEVESVCAVVTGRKPNRWGITNGEFAGFYDAKAQLERLLSSLRVDVTYEAAVDFAYLPGRTAEVAAAGRRIGVVGQLHPRLTADFDISTDVAMFELDIDALLPHVLGVVRFEPMSPYPAVEQDLAIIVDADTSAASALSLIEDSPLVRSAAVFDVYSGPPVPRGRKSLAFTISFQSSKKTLTEKDANAERERITERLRREIGAEVRE
jgi:phenylalanyl-tRNA synthetase beta chain